MGLDLKVAPKPGDPTEPKIRVLVCKTCQTLDELPDFEGRPEDDVLLQIMVENHPNHIGNLLAFPVKYWMVPSIKERIIEQIKGGSSGLDVLGTQHYTTRMQFAEDAMKCFQVHLRPKGTCPEWRHKSKALLPNTKAERKDVNLSIKDAPKIFLCDFCPVRMFYEMKSNEATGVDK